MDHLTDSEIERILRTLKRIAVVGLSPTPGKASYGVTRFMIQSGFDIVAVRPDGPPEILARPRFASLSEVPGALEIVNVFRKPEAVPEIVDEVLDELAKRPPSERPKVIWLQEGITAPEAEARARAQGLIVVSDRCIMREHARLIRP